MNSLMSVCLYLISILVIFLDIKSVIAINLESIVINQFLSCTVFPDFSLAQLFKNVVTLAVKSQRLPNVIKYFQFDPVTHKDKY